MIRPPLAMPAPPAASHDAPRRAASRDEAADSFVDWMRARATDPRRQPSDTPQEQATTPGLPVQTGDQLKPAPVAVTGLMPGSTIRCLQGASPAGTDPVATGFAVRLAHRAGAVELIALPWRLMATGGLAHMFGRHAQAATVGCRGTHAGPADSAMRMTGLEAFASGPAGGPGAYVETGETAMPFISDAAVSVEAFDAAEGTDLRVRADAPAESPWLARMLRWIDDQGGEATLWVRDFRLDEHEKRALVATLRNAAVQSGFRLHRIVINGRTQWHVHRPTRETAHAG